MRLSEEFRAPGAQYRAIPFWAWNGKLEREELLRQIERLAQMGFGGFFMHSRTGLGTPYLSKEWFHFINACADKGKALGLSAWLYDEDRWPSGTAGGAVTQNPAYRMRFLRLCEDADAAEGTPLARFAVRMDGERWVSYRPLAADEAPQAGETALRFAVVEMPCSSFYNGTTYVDTMNREATETFLQMTHQRYVEECGARIGDSILGIFTDEPHRGSLMTSFGQGVDAGERQIPWTAALPERFQEKYGYDLLANLPALFLKKDEMPAQIKWQYVELVEELFLENFARPIDQWCRAHRMILTGHVLHEDCLTAQTAMSGSMMRYYAEMELPGIDFLGEFGRCYWIAKQLQSVARQLNKPRLLSELDGCTGWQMGFENYKAVGDWQALYGINLRCPHLSWYTMEGQAKRDYPASIFHQSAWWKEYAYVEDYYARIARFAQDGEPVCRVLVVSPLESVWARIHPGWCDGLSAKEAHVKALEERYAQLFYLLQRRHIDFDYGDEGLMAEHAAAEGKRLRVGQARYDAVLVCGLDTVRGTTERMLHEFAAGGGRLIVCGETPKAVDCLPGEPEWPQAIRIPFEEEALAAALREYEVASLTLPGGEPARDILCQAKRVAGEMRLLLLNDNREAAVNGVELSIAGHGPVTRFIPETGELERLPARESEGAVHVRLDFAPKAMLLLSIGGAYPEAKAPRVCQIIARQECAASALRYELAEPNLCVLDQASVSLNGGAWSEELEILKADRHVRDLPPALSRRRNAPALVYRPARSARVRRGRPALLLRGGNPAGRPPLPGDGGNPEFYHRVERNAPCADGFRLLLGGCLLLRLRGSRLPVASGAQRSDSAHRLPGEFQPGSPVPDGQFWRPAGWRAPHADRLARNAARWQRHRTGPALLFGQADLSGASAAMGGKRRPHRAGNGPLRRRVRHARRKWQARHDRLAAV